MLSLTKKDSAPATSDPALEEGGHRPHGRQELTTTNILAVIVAGLGSFTFGYANNATAGSFAQTTFIAKFLSGSNADSVICGIIGGFLGGGYIGAIIQAPISNRWGRKAATGTGAVLVMISAALDAGAVDIAMFAVFRMTCGIGAGMLLANCPVYMSEIAPPHLRGMLVGNHAISIVWAYVISSCIALGFHFIEESYQWRMQFVVLTFVAMLLVASLFLLPESPRWLCEQERYDDAWKILKNLNKTTADPEAVTAAAEMAQIRAQIIEERTLPRGYVYIFKTPHLRHRAFCGILTWIMGQSTGMLVIANLTPTLFATLGYGTVLQLALAIVWCVCAMIGCYINAAIMDRVGRVKLLVFGGYLCTATMICEAVLQKYYLDGHNKSGVNGAVAMYFLFGVFYGSTVDCAAYVYIAEIWPTHLRSYGVTIGLTSFFALALAFTTPASAGFSAIGWKYYFPMIATCICSTTAIAFVCPETAGLTLEEINRKFGDNVALELNTAEAVAQAMMKGGAMHFENAQARDPDEYPLEEKTN
ncbi:general substrate transporter [Myxozyma melibiosi]|uniref:General substrate transporter n=1 Tax=Myxozyma melibiosi TaxID=54550 RepID=A0ABR1FAU0_9ASCO